MPAAAGTKTILWIEGLRGIVSVLVVITHVARAWDYPLFLPQNGPDATPRFLQLPIIRVPAQGRIGVPLFAFLTGFVCAAKPLRLAYQQDNQHAAVLSIARSAFRRPWRLMLPASFATLLSFLLATLGAYKSANRCDSKWVRFDAPSVEPLGKDLHRLFRALFTTWTSTDNPYDRHQWAMKHLLVAAFQVYGVLIITMGMRFRYRVSVHLSLMLYWWLNRADFTETVGSPLVLGTLVAELAQHRPLQDWIKARARLLSYVVSPIIMLTGLYLGSYPAECEDWAPWSRSLEEHFVRHKMPEGERGSFLIPEGTSAQRRFSSICVQLTIVALFLAPKWQEALTNKHLQWFGKHSFAVYLVHGTILRTVGVWIIYGITGEPWVKAGKNEDGTDQKQEWLHRRGGFSVFVSVVVFVVLTYAAAYFWVKYVDSTCHKFTLWLEKRMFQSGDTANGSAHSQEREKEREMEKHQHATLPV